MKVLILSCDMGEGHNSAAYAIADFLQKAKVECEVLDTLSLKSKSASKKAALTYLRAIRIPIFFRITYNMGKLVSSPKRKSPVYYKNRSYRLLLEHYIKEYDFDTVITTHLFPAETLTALKRENRLQATTLGILTDYTCSPFWEETELDYYVIPHKDLTDEFLKHGLPAEKLLPYGIPVRPAFYDKLPKNEARQKFNITHGQSFRPDKPWYMIMSGSMGFGKIGLLVSAIIRLEKTEVNIIVVCGTNHKLKNKLDFLFTNHSNIAILGFSKDIPLIMDACDVLFSKPGGLSSTEAAIKNIPIIHTAPIPGCETCNAAFFKEHGMSYSSSRIKKQLMGAIRLCQDTAYREAVIQSQKENMSLDTCDNIYGLLFDRIRKEGKADC